MRDEDARRHEPQHFHHAKVDVQVRLQPLDDAARASQPQELRHVSKERPSDREEEGRLNKLITAQLITKETRTGTARRF